MSHKRSGPKISDMHQTDAEPGPLQGILILTPNYAGLPWREEAILISRCAPEIFQQQRHGWRGVCFRVFVLLQRVQTVAPASLASLGAIPLLSLAFPRLQGAHGLFGIHRCSRSLKWGCCLALRLGNYLSLIASIAWLRSFSSSVLLDFGFFSSPEWC